MTIKDNDKEVFNSTRNHLLVNLNADPKHFDTVRILGTNQSVGVLGEAREILFKIEHKLNYTPMICAYMYASGDVSGAGLDTLGTYYRNFYSYLPLGGGGGDDTLHIAANDKYFYITHTTISYGAGFSSAAANTPVNVKYYIFSRPAYNNPTY